MLSIQNLLRPQSLDEAMEMFKTNKKARLIAGGAFMRLAKDLKTATVIDLYGIGLDRIIDKGDSFEIGAMVTLRDLETYMPLKSYYSGIVGSSVENIVGVQLRNIATVGGTVFSRYGFSDLVTALLSLDTTLLFYERGPVSLEVYLQEKRPDKDILKGLSIPKVQRKASFQMLRNSSSDFAILNAAVSVDAGDYRIAVGARPGPACLATRAMKYLNSQDRIGEPEIHQAAQLAMEELVFGSNRFGSADYRKEMCRVLVRRGLMEVLK